MSGFSFETVTGCIKILPFEEGETALRGHVQHLEILEGGPAPLKDAAGSAHGSACSPDAVVVYVGLEARFLGGVEDKTIHPSRDQTLSLHAP